MLLELLIIRPLRNTAAFLLLFQLLHQYAFRIIEVRIDLGRISLFAVHRPVFQKNVDPRVLAALFQVIKRLHHRRGHDDKIQDDVVNGFRLVIQIRKNFFQLFYFTGQCRNFKRAIYIRRFIFRFLILSITDFRNRPIQTLILAFRRSHDGSADYIGCAVVFKLSTDSIDNHFLIPPLYSETFIANRQRGS